MGRASGIQNAFDAGELSALLLGRQDLDKYKRGMFVCSNGLPTVQGPWTRRPGTAFLHQCKFNNRLTRVLPFQFSTTQTYILEFGHQYIRFFPGHAILVNATKVVENLVNSVVTITAHGYNNGDRLQYFGAVSTGPSASCLNNREIVVTSKTANTFETWDTDGVFINSNGPGGGVVSNFGSVAKIFEIATTYTEAELVDIRITQSADTLYITHPNHPPATLVRVSALSWTLADIVFTDGPYDVQNTTATTMTPSAATGSVTITASAVTGINNGQGFLSTDVGRLIRLREGSIWGYVLVTAYTSTTVVTATVLSTLTNTNAKTAWRMGVWSNTTGFPRCSTFYEDRLYFAGAAVFPQRLDGSNVSAYTNFSPSATDGTVSASNAVAATLNAEDVNAILWMTPHYNALLCGTFRGEWQVRGSMTGDVISPTSIQAKPTTRRGSAAISPVVAGDATIFVQRGGRKVREMASVIDGYGYRYKTPDMTALSEHITRPGINGHLAYQEQPQAIVWAPRSDGVLLGMSYDRDAGVVAWHRHALGGSSSADGLSIPVVESAAVVVDPTAVRDELYLVVQRYINGGTKRYIEYMSKVWQPGDTQVNAFYADAGWTDLAVGTNLIQGLSYLEGQTLNVYLDGAAHPNVTVAGGQVTFNYNATVKTVGYFYSSDGQTMPIEGGSQDGSAQGKIKRIHRLGLWLLDTLGLKIGPDANNLTEIIARVWGTAYGTATPLFTGVTRERFEADYDKLGQVYWRAGGPFPANVLALMPQFEVADDS